MIILVSKDFAPLAEALQDLYSEPGLAFLTQPNWIQDLHQDNKSKFIRRLSIIGHSDSFYGEEQAFFGGNMNERVMLIEEFSHSLITLLKYNERLKPGFCQHLKHIDLIDCHIGERNFVAQSVAEYFHEDGYLGKHGSHIKISSFANSQHLKSGTVLVTHPQNDHMLSFYSFNSLKAFNEYNDVHHKLDTLRSQLHNLEQMPGHTAMLTNGQSREEGVARLEKKCENLQNRKEKLLKDDTHKVLHISDPRKYLDQHKACQVVVGDVKLKSHHAAAKPSKKSHKEPIKHTPHFFAHKTTSTHSKHTSYLEGSMFKHTSKHPAEDELAPHLHQPKPKGV